VNIKYFGLVAGLGFQLLTLPTYAQTKIEKSDLDQLVKIMSGSFSSEAQSTSDSAFFHISLKMKPIWPTKVGENWLYVEQAMASALDKPYRQRI